MDLSSLLDLSQCWPDRVIQKKKKKIYHFLAFFLRYLGDQTENDGNREIKQNNTAKKKRWTKLKPYSFSEESAGDDEGGVDGGPAHDHLVKSFEKASAAASSSRWIHGDCVCLLYASLFLAPDLVR